MRQRLMQVLGTEDGDDAMTDVVLRFCTRAKPLSRPTDRRAAPQGGQVVDLSAWMRTRERPSRG